MRRSVTIKVLALAGLATLGAWQAARWVAMHHAETTVAEAAARQRRIESIGYYRVRAYYTVKGSGEVIVFDYVAACATSVTMYRDGDRSVDTPFGVAPKTMVLPTRDGHAIQVVTPKVCNREVEKDWIPPDLIPLTIWHDDVNNLAFGWGYMSQDAYDNARSRMGFEGATVTAATYADFLAWRAKAEAEFKPAGQIKSPWGFSFEHGSDLNVSQSCDLYVRTPVFPMGWRALNEEWVKRGKPEFWVYTTENSIRDGMEVPDFWDLYSRSQMILGAHIHPRMRGGGVGTIQLYSDQRWGKQHYGQDRVYPVTDIYPYLPISLASTPPPTLTSTVFPTKVPVSDDWKGLATCVHYYEGIDGVFHYDGRFNGKNIGGKIVAEEIGDRTRPFLVNDTVITKIRNDNSQPPYLFFQRDEFLFTIGSGPIEGLIP